MPTHDPAYFASRDTFVHRDLTREVIDQYISEECFVCLEPYRIASMARSKPNAEQPVKLSCGHVIGLNCILRWTSESNTCPLCRAILFEPTIYEIPQLANIDNIDLEPIMHWEQVWYEAIGIEPAYPPSAAPNEYFSLFSDFPDEEHFDSVHQFAQARCSCGMCERISDWHLPPPDGNRSPADAIQHAQEVMWDLTQQFQTVVAGLGFDATAAQYVEMFLVGATLPPEAGLEKEIMEAKASMEGLDKMHNEWMNEYASTIASEVEQDGLYTCQPFGSAQLLCAAW